MAIDKLGITILPNDHVLLHGVEYVVCAVLPPPLSDLNAPTVVLQNLQKEGSQGFYARDADLTCTSRWGTVRPGDRVTIHGEGETRYVVQDAYPCTFDRDMVPLASDTGESRTVFAGRLQSVREPPLVSYLDREGNVVVKGDTLRPASGTYLSLVCSDFVFDPERHDVARVKDCVRSGLPHSRDLRDAHGKMFGIGHIVWLHGRSYRVVFDVQDSMTEIALDALERLSVVAVPTPRSLLADASKVSVFDKTPPLDFKVAEVEVVDPDTGMRLHGVADPKEKGGIAWVDVFVEPLGFVDPAKLTTGERGALNALAKLGLAVEWGIFLAIVHHTWTKRPHAWLQWDVVGHPSQDPFTGDQRQVLLTFGVDGVDAEEHFVSLHRNPTTARRYETIPTCRMSPALTEAFVVPEDGYAPFAIGDVPEPVTRKKGATSSPRSPRTAKTAYDHAEHVLARVARSFDRRMARHYVPTGGDTPRPRAAVIEEFAEELLADKQYPERIL